MSKKQLSVQGKTFNGSKYEEASINIIYEVNDDEGQHIDLKAFNQLLKDYVNQQKNQQGKEIPDDTKVGCYFNKQLLLFLLSFDCEGILINKCYNSERQEESVAICAIDGKGVPLGLSETNITDNFVGGEWGKKVSYADMKNLFSRGEEDFNNKDFEEKFKNYFKSSKK